MSNYFQIIVDCEVSDAEAESNGQAAIAWLADQLIIDDEPSACAPDDRRGFGPAEAWQSAIVEIDEYFLGIDVNGVEVVTGRRIFDAGTYDSKPYCPACNAPLPSDSSQLADWKDALDRWARGEDQASLSCPACSADFAINSWRHDPPIGFGSLGLVFWNWPSLNREFIDRLAALLGHHLVLVEGKAPTG